MTMMPDEIEARLWEGASRLMMFAKAIRRRGLALRDNARLIYQLVTDPDPEAAIAKANQRIRLARKQIAEHERTLALIKLLDAVPHAAKLAGLDAQRGLTAHPRYETCVWVDTHDPHLSVAVLVKDDRLVFRTYSPDEARDDPGLGEEERAVLISGPPTNEIDVCELDYDPATKTFSVTKDDGVVVPMAGEVHPQRSAAAAVVEQLGALLNEQSKAKRERSDLG